MTWLTYYISSPAEWVFGWQLLSNGPDDRDNYNKLVLYFWRLSVWITFPHIIGCVKINGRMVPTSYGITIHPDNVLVFYGKQTDHWEQGKTKMNRNIWVWFWPWQWNFVSWDICNIDNRWKLPGDVFQEMDQQNNLTLLDGVYKTFPFTDPSDGKQVSVRCFVGERTWARGNEGFWRWLLMWWPTKVIKTLSLEFSEEVGSGKGSYKGGTLACGFDMLPNEHIDSAYARFVASRRIS